MEGQHVFAELCWLSGSLIVISVLLAIWVRLGTEVTEPELMAIAATALVALTGVIMNWPMFVALIAAPTLKLGFWVIEGLGFPIYSGYLAHYVREGWPIRVGFVARAAPRSIRSTFV